MSNYNATCTIGYYSELDPVEESNEHIFLEGDCLHTGRGEVLIDPSVIRGVRGELFEEE